MLPEQLVPARLRGHAPRWLEGVSALEDALALAGFLSAFFRNADVVGIANLARDVSVIAPILTGRDRPPRRSILGAFRHLGTRRDGDSLRRRLAGRRADRSTTCGSRVSCPTSTSPPSSAATCSTSS